MYFLIGGVQPRTVVLSGQPRRCPACGHPALFLKRIDHYLSLFFVPLVPVKRGVPIHICDKCSTTFGQYDEKIDGKAV